MSTYYVATRAFHVLVEAENEQQAGELGMDRLTELHHLDGGMHDPDMPFEIHTLRLATAEDVARGRWK